MNDEPDTNHDEHSGIRRLINTGAEIAGGAVGGALGFLASGPVGAALLGAGGAAAAAALKHIGEEASERLLGPREQDQHREQGDAGKPGDARLPERHDDEGGQQRPERTSHIAADLEHRLRETVPPAGGQTGDAGGFRVEYRGACSHHGGRQKQQVIRVGHGHQQQAAQREAHSHRQGIGFGVPVGVVAYEGLQQ